MLGWGVDRRDTASSLAGNTTVTVGASVGARPIAVAQQDPTKSPRSDALEPSLGLEIPCSIRRNCSFWAAANAPYPHHTTSFFVVLSCCYCSSSSPEEIQL